MTVFFVFEFRSIRHLQEGSQTDGKGNYKYYIVVELCWPVFIKIESCEFEYFFYVLWSF